MAAGLYGLRSTADFKATLRAVSVEAGDADTYALPLALRLPVLCCPLSPVGSRAGTARSAAR